MKNGEVLELYEALNNIEKNKNLVFNIYVSYIIAKNKAIIEKEAEIIYKLRRDIIIKEGEKADNGDIIIPKNKIEYVNNQIKNLMEMENDVVIRKIFLSDIENIELNINDMHGLMHMIDESIQFTSTPIIEKTPE